MWGAMCSVRHTQRNPASTCACTTSLKESVACPQNSPLCPPCTETSSTIGPLNARYSISLSHLEENAESLEVACEALRVNPDSLELIDHAITAAVDSGNFIKAKELCDRWDVVSPTKANPLASRTRQLAAAVEVGLFSERGVGQVLDTLSDVQRAAGLRTSNAVTSSDDVDGSFLYQRFIHATPAEASTLNERLADRIADHPDLMEDPRLRFVVVFTGEGSPDGRIP